MRVMGVIFRIVGGDVGIVFAVGGLLGANEADIFI